jgi:hypothetical protein
MTNPFAIPGLDNDPVKALCPWDEDTPEHEDFYAPIDHTEDAYLGFQQDMGNPVALRRLGRLVVVAGQSGCGKTSLMNRCAYWLRTHMKQKPHDVVVRVLDLRTASRATDVVSERMAQAARRLAQEVTTRNLVGKDDAAEVTANRDRCEDLFPVLNKALNDKLVLAVLLPPIELLSNADAVMHEIAEYGRLVTGKLVLFAEVTLADDPVHRLSTAKAPGARTPLILPVLPLKAGDGAAFSARRLEVYEETGGFPRMTQDAKEKIDENRVISVSVRSLQKFLYHFYEERRTRNDRYTDDDTVSYQDITEFFWKYGEFG